MASMGKRLLQSRQFSCSELEEGHDGLLQAKLEEDDTSLEDHIQAL